MDEYVGKADYSEKKTRVVKKAIKKYMKRYDDLTKPDTPVDEEDEITNLTLSFQKNNGRSLVADEEVDESTVMSLLRTTAID